jgi:hypothetical protein
MPEACIFNNLKYGRNGDENADKRCMGSINTLSSSYLQSILSSTLQSNGLTSNTGNSPTSGSVSSATLQSDNGQLSPFTQLMSTLQQLQQSDPTKYQQVTSQIATNLQSAAQTAQSDGNTAAANQLNQLATDFSDASKSGQLPSIQDLAKAIGGGHHHHHHAHAASSDSDSDSSTSSTSSSTSANQTLSQLLASVQSSSTQNTSLNPMSIILNTLSSAGIGSSQA